MGNANPDMQMGPADKPNTPARWAARRIGLVVGICLATGVAMGWPTNVLAQEQAITFWHSMGGRNGKALQELVDRFNTQHRGRIKVETMYQGEYANSLSKFKASILSKQLPDLMQVNEIGSRLIYDLKVTVPFGDAAKKAGFKADDLLKGIVDYYTIDGKLQSLPFNASAPMLYYNKTAFKQVGLNPDKPPQTLQEVRAAAEKLMVRSGNVTNRYGFAAAINGMLVEQYFARAGVEYCNNGNGRSGLATAVTWDHPTVRGVIDWWGSIMRDGIGLNAGRVLQDANAAFASGRAAMLTLTSAGMGDITRDAKFDVGVADFPLPEQGKNGPILNGGASIWIVAGQPAAKENASAQLLGYLGSPEAQAYWAAQTGYSPVNIKAVDTSEFKEVLKTYPNFAKPRAALNQVGTTPANRGCLMGVMPQAREKINEILEVVILGKASAEQALAEGQKSVAPLIAAYNRAIGH